MHSNLNEFRKQLPILLPTQKDIELIHQLGSSWESPSGVDKWPGFVKYVSQLMDRLVSAPTDFECWLALSAAFGLDSGLSWKYTCIAYQLNPKYNWTSSTMQTHPKTVAS